MHDQSQIPYNTKKYNLKFSAFANFYIIKNKEK